jgi:hypothetical protein
LNVGCTEGFTTTDAHENNRHYCEFATYLELNDGSKSFNTTGYRL